MTAPTEREVLEALWHKIAGPDPIPPEKWPFRCYPGHFFRLLDAGAYLDAALMMVPRGWIVEIVRSFDDDGAFFSTVKLTDSFTIGRGCDPDEEVSVTARKGAITTFHDPTALAICAAIEAAIAALDPAQIAGEQDMSEPTEREVLEALWDRVDMRGYAIRARFTAMLDAEAYESAALMLVPKGQDWAVGSTIKGDFFANLDFDKAVHSTTPALALCAAIEAALAREGE